MVQLHLSNLDTICEEDLGTVLASFSPTHREGRQYLQKGSGSVADALVPTYQAISTHLRTWLRGA